MSQPDLFVGIDVAKDELVIQNHPAGMLWRVPNTKTGVAALGRKLVRLAGTTCLRIGFEASGGYERRLAILLDQLGLAPICSIRHACAASPAPSGKSPRPTRSMPPSSHDALLRCTSISPLMFMILRP